MKKGRITAIIITTLLFSLSLVFSAQAVIKIGVLAKRGVPRAMQKWGATAGYLSQKLGDRVIIIPLKFVAIDPMVKNGRIDFLLANSAFYVDMEKKYQIRAIATLINSRQGKALTSFGGVVFTTRDSPINSLNDIKGKKFMLVKYSSFGGGLMAWRLFLDNGINPRKDFASFIEGNKHDNVVLAVQRGIVDAGTVRTDTLERMTAEGKIKMADFKIIHQVKDSFPFVHSTRLYPEWPMAALKATPKALADKMAAALKAITAASPAAKAAKIVGWTKAADYTPVRECIEAIERGGDAN